jgi:hypothetical protein
MLMARPRLVGVFFGAELGEVFGQCLDEGSPDQRRRFIVHGGGFGGCVYVAAARRHNGRIRRPAQPIDRSV